MTAYRKIKVEQDAYMVTCDNCGGEDGPYPSPPRDGVLNYCRLCHRTCQENNALELHQGLKGARVIGFRFRGTRLLSLVLKKGKRVMEVWAPGRDEDGDSRHLDFQDGLRLVNSCYTFKRQKPPARRKR